MTLEQALELGFDREGDLGHAPIVRLTLDQRQDLPSFAIALLL
jgi:hypothetical protein